MPNAASHWSRNAGKLPLSAWLMKTALAACARPHARLADSGGPRWVRETHGFSSLPLLVRPNTVLPVGSVESRPDYDFADGVTLHVYALEEGRSVTVTVPTLGGAPDTIYTVRRKGGAIHVEARGSGKDALPDDALLGLMQKMIKQMGSKKGFPGLPRIR